MRSRTRTPNLVTIKKSKRIGQQLTSISTRNGTIKLHTPLLRKKIVHIHAKEINPFKMSRAFPLMIPLSSSFFPYHYLYPCVYVNVSSSSPSSSDLLPIFLLNVFVQMALSPNITNIRFYTFYVYSF